MGTRVLETKAISATPYPLLGIREVPEVLEVCKLIDVSICIGCKACEVACQEWNDLPVSETYTHFGSYQTLPDLAHNFWNLIKFKELENKGKLLWTMAKYQCMHCEDPGCLRACPAPGAIVQYTNGIVDFVQKNCIGCQFCVTGCPFNVPRINPKTQKVYKCTLCADRVESGLEPACIKACPTDCLHFGLKKDLVRMGLRRVKQLRDQGFENAILYDPHGVLGAHVIYVLPFGNRPEYYGLPRDPEVPATVNWWKGPLKLAGNIMMVGGVTLALLHYLKFGPMELIEEKRRGAPGGKRRKTKK